MNLCEYGCGQEAKYQFKNGKWCCSNHYSSCPQMQKINSKNNKDKNHSEETKNKMHKSQIKRYKNESFEEKEKRINNHKIASNKKEVKQKHRQNMINYHKNEPINKKLQRIENIKKVEKIFLKMKHQKKKKFDAKRLEKDQIIIMLKKQEMNVQLEV